MYGTVLKFFSLAKAPKNGMRLMWELQKIHCRKHRFCSVYELVRTADPVIHPMPESQREHQPNSDYRFPTRFWTQNSHPCTCIKVGRH